MGFGIYFRTELEMVSGRCRICVAAKYMLDIYIIVRLLLVVGKKKMEKRLINFYRGIDNYGGDSIVHAGKSGYFRSADIDRLLYFYNDSVGKTVEKM